MDSDERLLQVLDQSACLSKGQLLGYRKQTLYPEELRAVEMHLNSCPFCSDALEGFNQEQDMEQLLSGLFPPPLPAQPIREQIKEPAPAVQKAEPAPAAHKEPVRTEPISRPALAANVRPMKKAGHWRRNLGIAAALIIGFGILWYVEFRKQPPETLALNTIDTTPPLPPPAAPELKPIASRGTRHQGDTAAHIVARKKDTLHSLHDADVKLIAQKTKDSAKIAATQDKVADQQQVTMAAKARASEREEEKGADKQKEDDSVPALAARSAEPEKTNARNSEKEESASDFEMGLKMYKQKQYASALMYFRTVESDKSNAKYWDAVYYSALCHKNLNKNRRARKLFERIVEENAPHKKAAQKELDNMKND